MMYQQIPKIYLLSTGGTIEKTYDETDGSLQNRRSHIREHLLSALRLPHTQIEVQVVMAKDSLEFKEQDRELILGRIKDLQQHGAPIVILHGTDTMEITGKFCYDRLDPEVPVIFTGAMKPWDLIGSDAQQNVIEALCAAKLLPAGFYITFHNQVFKLPKVRKNRQRGTFESF